MPTNQDETLQQRYARDHQDYLKLCGSMTAEQVADLQLQLNNALDNKEDLRDELALLKKEFGTQRGKLNCMILHCAALETSLTIAEQQNADAVELLESWQTWLGARRESCDEHGKVLWDRIDAVVKPTESGASE